MSIGDGIFYDCNGLMGITIPRSVTSIARSGFRGCSGLTEVTIPESVTRIGRSSFSGCRQLKDVYYAGSEEQWQKIAIRDYNDSLTSAKMHYNSSGSSTGDSDTQTKSTQIITANNLTKTYGEKAFSLGAKSSGSGTLSTAKSKKKKTVAVKWKRGKEAVGYIIKCATGKKFKKNKKQMTIGTNKTTSTTVKS